MIEIRVTRPERYSMIEPDLSARGGHYFRGKNQRDCINQATIQFGAEVIDVEIKHGPYLGAFKRIEIHGPDECFVQLPHTIPGVSRIEQLLAGVEGNVTVHDGILTLEDGTQHGLRTMPQLAGGYQPGTKSYVLNDLHIALQEVENGSTLEDALSSIGCVSLDEMFARIEEVRDNDE